VRGVLVAVVGVGGQHHAVLALDRGDRRAEVEPHAPVLVQVGEEAAELRAQRPEQRGGLRFDDRHLGAVAARGGGDLQADPARADQQQPSVLPAQGLQGGPQPLRVVQLAQVVDAAQFSPGDVQRARGGAGGEQQPVVGQHGPVAEVQRAGLPVQPGGRGADPQFDLVLGVPGRLVHEEVGAGGGRREVTLRQVRALVRGFTLLADQDHPAGETLGPQGLGGLGPGEAGSDDDMGLVCVHHRWSPVRSLS
jgi:hypothetical protein